MNEWVTAMQARKWMKKNESFLPGWHAYVGAELGLFDDFAKAKTVADVSDETGYPYDLLSSWVRVGVAVKHLKKRPNHRYRTSKKRCASLMGDNASTGVKALLKEVMELHMPTLLGYPEYMRNNQRAYFDHERHGEVVAETSALLEHFSIKKIKKMIHDRELDTIVDLGCGHGGYLRKLAESYPNVQMIGIDLNQDVVDRASELAEGYPNLSFEVADVMDWTPEGSGVDVILLHNVFHYIQPDVREQLMNHLYSYLNKDGLISVVTPVNETEHGEEFSSAFNSFFVAHSNLFALPNTDELNDLAESCHFDLFDFDPIIKEGSWYTFWLTPSIRVNEIGRYQQDEGTEQTYTSNRQLTKSS